MKIKPCIVCNMIKYYADENYADDRDAKENDKGENDINDTEARCPSILTLRNLVLSRAQFSVRGNFLV